MGVTFESAYLGDERSRVSVLDSLRKKVNPDGSISVPVDSSLIPILQVGGTIELTRDEINTAKEKAVVACGGPNDAKCIEKKQADFQRERLQEKELESQSNANIIKGRRLTVTLDENGKKRTLEVPEGQKFEYGTPASSKGSFDLDTAKWKQNFSVGPMVWSVIKYLTLAGATFLYAFSILATWKMFQDAGMVIPKFVATAAAVVFPYIGAFGGFLFLVVRSWVQKMPTPAPVIPA